VGTGFQQQRCGNEDLSQPIDETGAIRLNIAFLATSFFRRFAAPAVAASNGAD
jgi:hypothetical protein